MSGYDVFLSYSKKDKSIVHPLAERLRADGVRVWLDDWEIRLGGSADSIPAKIEQGLEGSSVLVLCMSGNAFASDWPTLESQTFRFRDPLNKDRRFIPLRLDDAPAKGSLAQFSYIDWRSWKRQDADEYARLLESCKPQKAESQREAANGILEGSGSLGHTSWINSVAFSPDGRRVLSGSDDNTLLLWDVETGKNLRVLEGHFDSVTSVTFSPDGERVLSGSDDDTLRLWDVEAGKTLGVLEGHSGNVLSVAFSPDGKRVLSGSGDATLRLWDVKTGKTLGVLEGHSFPVLSPHGFATVRSVRN